MALWGRPDLADFEVGALYHHHDTGEVVEFIGIASVDELAGEDVAVFRFVELVGGCLIATKHDYYRGDTFERVGSAIADEIEEQS
jgi:hypothetical protein